MTQIQSNDGDGRDNGDDNLVSFHQEGLEGTKVRGQKEDDWVPSEESKTET